MTDHRYIYICVTDPLRSIDQLLKEKKYQEVVDVISLNKAPICDCVKYELIKAECLVYLGQHTEALNLVNNILFSSKDDYVWHEAICIRALSLMHQEKYMQGLVELREIMHLSPRAKSMYIKYMRLIKGVNEANEIMEKLAIDC